MTIDPNKRLVQKANQLFRDGEFAHALSSYRNASILYGKDLFNANQELCIRRYSSQLALGNCTIPRKATNNETPADIRVALIADEFTSNSFSEEFIAIPLLPNDWQAQFEKYKPQIFFCESAWSGPNSTLRPWKGKVYASSNFKNENRLELLAILSYCRKNNIPSVFWNKEDPTHYTDRIHDFVATACEFDHVFTTAIECIERYNKEYQISNVYPLPFATNPRLFNPFQRNQRHDGHIVFAGSWYENHKRRCIDMRNTLSSCMREGLQPVIYDRYHGDSDPLHLWPSRFAPYIRPGLPHSKMPEVYKSCTFGLNINTVTASSSMFARRVFELMSSRTIVISNHSVGCKEIFGDLIVYPTEQKGRIRNMSNAEISSIADRAAREVLSKHTYRDRWQYILKTIGFRFSERRATLAYTCLIRSSEEALKALAIFDQWRHLIDNPQFLVVAGVQIQNEQILDLYQKFNQRGVTVTSASYLKHYASLERYSPIEADFFLAFDMRTIPSQQWIEQAIPYLASANGLPICAAPEADRNFFIGTGDMSGFFIAHRMLFLEWIINPRQRRDFAFI